MRDEFKKREKQLNDIVHSVEERVHALERAIKASLPTAAAGTSASPVPASHSATCGSAAASILAAEDEWQNRVHALRREWMTYCQALDERLASVERECVRSPDLDARLTALSTDIATDVHQRWTLIAQTIDQKLSLLERYVPTCVCVTYSATD